MIVDFIRDFVGGPPEFFTIANLPALIEYVCALGLCIGLVALIIHLIFILFKIFTKKG